MKKKLNAKHLEFARLVLEGNTLEKAGKAIGISKATASKWYNNTDVRLIIEELRHKTLKEIEGSLLVAGRVATATLRELCQNKNSPAHVRATSAKAILDALLKVRETLDIEHRLNELDAKITRIEQIQDSK